MSIEGDFAWDRWTTVTQPSPAPGVPRVERRCPVSLLDQFWRATPTGAWFLPGDNPAWDTLPKAGQQLVSEDPVIKQHAAIEAFGRDQAAWETRVRSTDWGSDPNWWRPIAHLDASASYYDPVRKAVRSPHRELMEKYGTTSLVEYARWQGMPPPVLQL